MPKTLHGSALLACRLGRSGRPA